MESQPASERSPPDAQGLFDDGRRRRARSLGVLRQDAPPLATLGGLHRKANGENQHRTIEQRLDKKRRAELAQAGLGTNVMNGIQGRMIRGDRLQARQVRRAVPVGLRKAYFTPQISR